MRNHKIPKDYPFCDTATEYIKETFPNVSIDCLRYDFEQNKKNNLIFHGIIADHPETPEG